MKNDACGMCNVRRTAVRVLAAEIPVHTAAAVTGNTYRITESIKIVIVMSSTCEMLVLQLCIICMTYACWQYSQPLTPCNTSSE